MPNYNQAPDRFKTAARVFPKSQKGHVLPRQPVIDLDTSGRLRTAHVLAIIGLSHSTLCSRLKKGSFPQPDGRDPRNYWNTSTIRDYLDT